MSRMIRELQAIINDAGQAEGHVRSGFAARSKRQPTEQDKKRYEYQLRYARPYRAEGASKTRMATPEELADLIIASGDLDAKGKRI